MKRPPESLVEVLAALHTESLALSTRKRPLGRRMRLAADLAASTLFAGLVVIGALS